MLDLPKVGWVAIDQQARDRIASTWGYGFKEKAVLWSTGLFGFASLIYIIVEIARG